MARLVKDTVAGIAVEAQPLPFKQAQELLPDIMQVVSTLLSHLGAADLSLKDPTTLSTAIFALGRQLGDGKLAYLAPKVLACTVAVADDRRYELGNDKHRADFFDAHPEAYLPTLMFAGKVTFAGFFRGAVPAGGGTQTASP
jgi:ABC-type Fe2+-enterobactin transport system substrate-binding protein